MPDAGDRAKMADKDINSFTFTFVASLVPARDDSGTIVEYSPQGRYKKADIVPLLEYGDGTFCSFSIVAEDDLEGVYALVVDQTVCYIGACADLIKQLNEGFGTISPANCYEDGQSTNCKINHHVLEVTRAGGRVDLYFYSAASQGRSAIKKQLLAYVSPPWND